MYGYNNAERVYICWRWLYCDDEEFRKPSCNYDECSKLSIRSFLSVAELSVAEHTSNSSCVIERNRSPRARPCLSSLSPRTARVARAKAQQRYNTGFEEVAFSEENPRENSAHAAGTAPPSTNCALAREVQRCSLNRARDYRHIWENCERSLLRVAGTFRGSFAWTRRGFTRKWKCTCRACSSRHFLRALAFRQNYVLVDQLYAR